MGAVFVSAGENAAETEAADVLGVNWECSLSLLAVKPDGSSVYVMPLPVMLNRRENLLRGFSPVLIIAVSCFEPVACSLACIGI